MNTHVIVLIQLQFQCSSFRVNERALQTEGPSQRTNDDDPGTFLLMHAQHPLHHDGDTQRGFS